MKLRCNANSAFSFFFSIFSNWAWSWNGVFGVLPISTVASPLGPTLPALSLQSLRWFCLVPPHAALLFWHHKAAGTVSAFYNHIFIYRTWQIQWPLPGHLSWLVIIRQRWYCFPSRSEWRYHDRCSSRSFLQLSSTLYLISLIRETACLAFTTRPAVVPRNTATQQQMTDSSLQLSGPQVSLNITLWIEQFFVWDKWNILEVDISFSA